MSDLLKRIADYFTNCYQGDDKTAPTMEITVTDLRYIANMNVERCRAEAELRNLQYVKTNADRIRNMTDEELAETIPCPHMVNWKKGNYDTCVHPNGKDGCKKCILEWLRSEIE